MKTAFVLTVALALWIGVGGMPNGEKYTTKFDNVDVDSIIKNDRLLNGYVKCLLSKGPCTPDGAELKKLLPDAIKTECTKCSDKQRNNTKKVLLYLIDNKPDVWAELEAQYDKEGTYKKKYCDLAKKEGTVVKACGH